MVCARGSDSVNCRRVQCSPVGTHQAVIGLVRVEAVLFALPWIPWMGGPLRGHVVQGGRARAQDHSHPLPLRPVRPSPPLGCSNRSGCAGGTALPCPYTGPTRQPSSDQHRHNVTRTAPPTRVLGRVGSLVPAWVVRACRCGCRATALPVWLRQPRAVCP